MLIRQSDEQEPYLNNVNKWRKCVFRGFYESESFKKSKLFQQTNSNKLAGYSANLVKP